MTKTKELTYYPILDDAITLYLKRNGMKQAQLAEMLGMSENTLSWKRRGIREFSVEEARKLCDLLGIRLDHAVSVQNCDLPKQTNDELAGRDVSKFRNPELAASQA